MTAALTGTAALAGLSLHSSQDSQLRWTHRSPITGHLPRRSVLDSGYPNRRVSFVMTIARLYSVPGMSCDNCVDTVTDHVTPLDGVTDLEFNLDARTVTITGGDDAAITAAIDEAGFVIR